MELKHDKMKNAVECHTSFVNLTASTFCSFMTMSLNHYTQLSGVGVCNVLYSPNYCLKSTVLGHRERSWIAVNEIGNSPVHFPFPLWTQGLDSYFTALSGFGIWFGSFLVEIECALTGTLDGKILVSLMLPRIYQNDANTVRD